EPLDQREDRPQPHLEPVRQARRVEPRAGDRLRAGPGIPGLASRALASRPLVVEHERHAHHDAELDDLSLLDRDLLLCDPGAPDVLDLLAGALDADDDGVVEALARRGDDLGDFRDGHGFPPAELCRAVTWKS